MPIDLQWGARSLEDIEGVPVHVEVAGALGAPVLGLLHGFSSGTFTWAGVAPALADQYRLVAWDRPPFGRSGRPAPRRGPGDPYAPAVVLRQASEVLHRHGGGGDPVVLVGHSAGGLVALEVASARSAPLAGLVLVAPAFGGGPPAVVRRAFGLPGAAVVGTAALGASLAAAGPLIRAVGRHRTPLLDATAAESGRLLRRPGTARALVHLTRTWRPGRHPGRADLGDLPILVLAGEDDRIGDPRADAAWAAANGAELHLLAGVGHAPQEQVPDVVTRVIRAFVQSVAR